MRADVWVFGELEVAFRGDGEACRMVEFIKYELNNVV